MIFKNIVLNYIANQALAEAHPTKNFERCINRHQVKHKCTACSDVCPEQVYSGIGSRNADYTKCVNCGLCVAACPSRCIASSAANAASYLKLLKLPEKSVYIASAEYEGSANLTVNSFASLPWEYLVCIGLRKKVVFITAGQSAQSPQAKSLWSETQAHLKYFFGEEEYHKRFVFFDPANCDQELTQEFDRRELFQKLHTEIRSQVSSFVPSESMMDGLLYRHLLKELLAENSSPASFGWIIPLISSKCKGCGVCAKLCPQDAIRVRKDHEQFAVYLLPLLCNHCGLCQKTCIHYAIEGFGLVHTDSLKPMVLFDSRDEEKEARNLANGQENQTREKE